VWITDQTSAAACEDERMRHPLPRRHLLAGGASVGVAGLLLGSTGCEAERPERAAEPGPDPLEPLLAGKDDLLRRYDAAATRFPALAPRLAPLRAASAAHLAAMRALVDPRRLARLAEAGPAGSTPTPAGSSPTPAAAVAALAAAERAAAARSAAACLAAEGPRVALLGSIAACEASHAAVLR